MKILLLVTSLIVSAELEAQHQLIPVETAHNALVLQTDSAKDLRLVYFGPRLAKGEEYAQAPEVYRQPEDYTGLLNSAYTPSGSRNLVEPAITVTHADGNPSLDLRYISHQSTKIDDNISLLTILLKDPVYDFEVTLYYKSYFAEDVVEQWSMIRHHEQGNVVLQKYASANLWLQGRQFWLRQYHGDWAREMQPEEAPLTHGIKTLDTKLGTRADLFQPPVFMISMDRPATETSGSVLYGGLEWSGNFRFDLELDPQDNLRIIAGCNNYASPMTLAPDSSLVTPPFVYTFSDQGKGAASRQLHRWARNYKVVDGNGQRLTLLNNWEATNFNFNETRLAGLLKDTKALGVDLFLLDDGWFGNKFPRNDDHTSLGDWQANKTKLPNGITALVREAGKNAVKFGIWVEPEMVSPKSVLYEQHPDWVIRQAHRKEYYYRNQLVLDLANPQVQEFVFSTVDGLFAQNPGLAYIKWDCNAVIYNAWSSWLGKDQSHFYYDYVEGLYKVLKRLRAKYPTTPMMLCSGGGGRVDYGALQYFTEYWPSDNTDPVERIFIQWEDSYFYPAIASGNHVTDWSRLPIKFRVDVAMMGKLGFDIVLDKLPAADLTFCRQAVATYDQIKSLVWHGDQYRLSDPREDKLASVCYLDSSASSGVIFNYLLDTRYGAASTRPIRLQGLRPTAKYRIQEIDLYPGTKTSLDEKQIYTGEFLMKIGFNPDCNLQRTSVILRLNAVQ